MIQCMSLRSLKLLLLSLMGLPSAAAPGEEAGTCDVLMKGSGQPQWALFLSRSCCVQKQQVP